jgi:pimeloyl-ACP methyl ester carboxylesterase
MSPGKKVALSLATFALIGVAIVIAAYQVEIRAIRAKVLAGGRIAETATGQIEYAIAGAGTPLLSIHGASGGYDQGLITATAFVGDGFEVIAPSRFGYLRTPVPSDASPAAQADAYVTLLDVLGVDRTIVVGLSAGAPLAMQPALRHPERVASLILFVPRGYVPEQGAEINSLSGQRAKIDSLPGGIAVKMVRAGADFGYWLMLRVRPSMLTRFVGVPPEVLEKAGPDDRRRVNGVLTAILPPSMRFAGITIDASARIDEWPLDSIAAPTLIVTASDDLFHTQPAAEYAAAHIPSAKLIVYPTGGHLFIGHTADVRNAIAAFLEQPLPAVSAADGPTLR